MTYWFRVYGHDRGVSAFVPDFVVADRLVFPVGCAGPSGVRAPGERTEPWFAIVDSGVFPTPHHPDGTSERPWYELLGSFVYAAEGHPGGSGTAPWYQARRPTA